MDMDVEFNVEICMDDGTPLRADVFRPAAPGRYPVILSHGLYAKGLPFSGGVYDAQWRKLLQKDPSVLEGSTNAYQAWEVTDPERWVPEGYVIVRVDSRGAGCSPGYMDPFSAREIDDACACVEWAGVQEWSNGRVGMLGISYYAVTQWLVAARRPAHLAAIIPWEGFADLYRGLAYHGGIRSRFIDRWFPLQVVPIQYGQGDRAPTSPHTGRSVAGDVTLSAEELGKGHVDFVGQVASRPLDDPWYRERSAELSKINVPLLSAANWGGQGIHPTGNFEGFLQAGSSQKWLEVHGDTHYTHFYSSYGRGVQKRFFDYYLKGVDNGWDREPPVLLNIRYPDETFALRKEHEWPLARTRWTRFYLDAESGLLCGGEAPGAARLVYDPMSRGATFRMPTSDADVEITGPMAAKLFISSASSDADVFVIVRLFDPEGREITFEGTTDPNTPIANGWLRASHRQLDMTRSLPYRPYHPHDRRFPLQPGTVYELDVEIWPTCLVIPAGYTLAVTIRGCDYAFEGDLDDYGKSFYYATRGTGGMTHDDPADRPPATFSAPVTLHTGGSRASSLLLPVIPDAG